MVDIKYSQNFYTNKTNLQRIIKLSNINSNDIVLDIGAGTGILTEELSKYAKKVISYELDEKYFYVLEEKFSGFSNVLLKNKDFLNEKLPQENFKVFSNIPFSLTSEILNKITDSESQLTEAYLFLQKESAERYMGISKNTQIASIISSLYDLDVIETFDRQDFKPVPSVDIVLFRILKKKKVEEDFELYRDFVAYIFNQMNSNVLDTLKKLFTSNQLKYIKEYLRKNNYKKPSEISSKYYLEIFQFFKINGVDCKNRVNGYYINHVHKHLGMEKVNRTRLVNTIGLRKNSNL